MEETTLILQRIDEVLTSVKEFITEIREKEKLITRMQNKIIALDSKRVELEASLPAREAQFRASLKQKEDEIIQEAMRRAEVKSLSILAVAKAENANLVSKNESLNNQVNNLNISCLKRSAEVNSSIGQLDQDKNSLIKEVALLTSTRDELLKQVESIKGKFAALVK